MQRPFSMTGFGRGEGVENGIKWTAEVRSVNHRFLDVKIRMPRQFLFFEERIKKTIGSHYSRGHVDVFLEMLEEKPEEGRLKTDLALAREYYNCLVAVKEELSLAGDPDLAIFSTLRDIIVPAQEDDLTAKADIIWPGLERALENALDNASEMRSQEGNHLKEDMQIRLARFGEVVNELETSIPDIIKKREDVLSERLETLLAGVDLDPIRLAQEVAIIVDKSDVSEELVRLRSHMKQFSFFLDSDEPVGRKIDFLLQEFLRELNTVTSKISSASASYMVVDLKNELEKMREQVQNLE
jgi:uncharacterized protein (TIGR00255 family)